MKLVPVIPRDHDDVEALFFAAFDGYIRALGKIPAPGQYVWLAPAIDASRVWWLGEDRAGCAVLSSSGTTLTIDQIGIAAGQQGKGLGTQALAVIEAHARERGMSEIQLHTAQVATRQIAFYSRCGFRVHAVGPHPKGRDDRLRVFLVKSIF